MFKLMALISTTLRCFRIRKREDHCDGGRNRSAPACDRQAHMSTAGGTMPAKDPLVIEVLQNSASRVLDSQHFLHL